MSNLSSWQTLSDEVEAIKALAAYELSGEESLYTYCQRLKEFDAHTNLVANSEPGVVLKEHILDSLLLLPWIKNQGNHFGRLIDIGCGAGFPGLVLAIAEPDLKVTLVESIGKKCRFLSEVIDELGLQKRVRVLCERAETLGHDKKLRENFDFATARAVGALPIVAELCIPFLKINGHLLAQRSKRQVLEEEELADAYASKLGGNLVETVQFPPDLLGREFSMLLIKKVKATPRTYPRTAGQMKRDLPAKKIST